MIEAATSGRATCRSCKQAIAKGELRWGDEVPGNFDGMMTFWYHLPCAVQSRPEQFGQELKRHKKPPIPDRAELEARIDGATVAAREKRMKKVERAPTGRASCQHCKVSIAKDTLRIAVWVNEIPMGGTGFVHVGCASGWTGSHPEDLEEAVLAKTAKGQKAAATAILASVKLLETDARGQELERGVQQAKKPAAEISVLADWLEERGCAVPDAELSQLLAARKKKLKKPKKA